MKTTRMLVDALLAATAIGAQPHRLRAERWHGAGFFTTRRNARHGQTVQAYAARRLGWPDPERRHGSEASGTSPGRSCLRSGRAVQFRSVVCAHAPSR